MICDICGKKGAPHHRVTRSHGRGGNLLVIEKVPFNDSKQFKSFQPFKLFKPWTVPGFDYLYWSICLSAFLASGLG